MAEPIRNAHNAEQASKFGHYLRELRKQRGLTLREIEERTTISNSYLSQLENGYIDQPSPRNLQRLAEAYGISYESLMTQAGYLSPRDSSATSPHRAAFNIIDDLSDDEVEEVQDFVKFLRFRRQQQQRGAQ
ncbi:MAG: XRE family transcriptional regulator [Candidatus Chloroheliales bacterium]|nr:MAG: XRE family transcriptional regulator [Chloroflexota bacterium]